MNYVHNLNYLNVFNIVARCHFEIYRKETIGLHNCISPNNGHFMRFEIIGSLSVYVREKRNIYENPSHSETYCNIKYNIIFKT